MRYLVVSDNHGDRDILVQLVDRYETEVDYMFHCGDSELSIDDKLWQHFYVVRGNCDYSADFKNSRVIETPQDTIYITHGHLSNVRFGLTNLFYEAKEANANIALFGHIHRAVCEVEEGILFVNPGSISQPREPIQIPSFAIIESTESEYRTQYYNRDFRPIEELSATFAKK